MELALYVLCSVVQGDGDLMLLEKLLDGVDLFSHLQYQGVVDLDGGAQLFNCDVLYQSIFCRVIILSERLAFLATSIVPVL